MTTQPDNQATAATTPRLSRATTATTPRLELSDEEVHPQEEACVGFKDGSSEDPSASWRRKKLSMKDPEQELLDHITMSGRESDVECGIIDLEATKKKLHNAFSRATFYHAAILPAVVMINTGRFDDLTVEDVQELFTALDADRDGTVDFHEMALFLKEVLSPPCTEDQCDAIYGLTDQRDDGKIYPDELHRALTSGATRQALQQMQRENKVINDLEKALGLNVEVTRDLLVEKLMRKTTQNDALRALPVSVAYIFVFAVLVNVHLSIFDRQRVEIGLEDWIEDYGGQYAGPFLENVRDIDGMFTWLEESGLPSVFGFCKGQANSSLPRCEVGSKAVLVGDAVLKQAKRDGPTESVWLLGSLKARQHLQNHPTDYLGAAVETIHQARRSLGANSDIIDLQLTFNIYTRAPQLFAMADAKVHLDDYGFVLPSMTAAAVVATPYPVGIGAKIGYFALDAVYLGFLLVPLYSEVKDLRHAIHLAGFRGGFRDYWMFSGSWTGVDWVVIVLGLTTVSVWISCCVRTQADSIQRLLSDENGRMVLAPGLGDISEAQLELLEVAFRDVRRCFTVLHVVMGFKSIALMFNFFKAFHANPRLQLVTNTLGRASGDILHFSIVFVTTNLGFAVIGHILFGSDILAFKSFADSVNTCFTMLLGDIEWYANESSEPGSMNATLPSGLPYWVMGLWFWVYMVAVLEILLNMLLGIILDHYNDLVEKIKNDVDVPTLWEQSWTYLQHVKKTNRYIPYVDLLCLLEDDPSCHESENVTARSLSDAFPDMPHEQVTWMMTWLKSEAKKKLNAIDDEIVGRLKVLDKFTQVLLTDLKSIKLNAAVCTSRLKRRDEIGQPVSVLNNGSSAEEHVSTSGMLDQLNVQVDQVALQLGGAIRDLSCKLNHAAREVEKRINAVKMVGEQPRKVPGTSERSCRSPPKDSTPEQQTYYLNKGTVLQLPACWEAASGFFPPSRTGPREEV